MDNLRTYGAAPYDLVLLHGGPGAPFTLEPLARRLSISFGVLEPAILSLSVEKQIEELHLIVSGHSKIPLFFIGHSWGAWLSLIYAATHPDQVKKVIMIGAPPFEKEYVHLIEENRLSRLDEKEQNEYIIAVKQLDDISLQTESLSPELTGLLARTDVFDAISNETIGSKFFPAVYKSVWNEASLMRQDGRLMGYVRHVRCPVVAIHGDYDPHPAEGVTVPLSEALPDFRFNLIEKCGHYPWKEKYGKDILYKILYKEIGSTCV